MKKILFSAVGVLLLASCGSDTTGNPGTGGGNTGGGTGTSTLTKLSGKVYSAALVETKMKALPWTRGQQPVSLEVVTSYRPLTTKVISSGTISAAGELSLVLPDTDIPAIPISEYKPVAPGTTLFTYECTGNFTAGNKNVKMVSGSLKVGSMGLLVGVKDANMLSDLMPQGQIHNVTLIYADGATSWNGTSTCKFNYGQVITTSTVTTNVQLVKGWNVMALDGTASADNMTYTTTMTTLSAAPENWYVLGK